MSKQLVLCALCALLSASLSSKNENPEKWYLESDGSTSGINLNEAREIIRSKGAEPKRKVIVAVIDGGIDPNHTDFKNLLWTNSKEIAGNGIDDDKNGFADDIRGWNFLGASNGKDILRSGKAEYREYQRLRPIYLNADTAKLSKKARLEYDYWKKMERRSGFLNYSLFGMYLDGVQKVYDTCDSLMRLQYDTDTAKIRDFFAIDIADTTGLTAPVNAMAMMLLGKDRGSSWNDAMKEQKDKHDVAQRNIASVDDPLSDSHRKIGNNPDDLKHLTGYGNNHLYISEEDAMHATMVTGIVAELSTKLGSEIEIIAERAVPDGDEYDRDIAAAIKYAVDNGAKVINCSFGKYVSDHSEAVVRQLKRAARKDVLLVMAAGNEGKNTSETPVYPSGRDKNGKRLKNVLIIGASGENGLPMGISNYSKDNVDLFAPGERITSSYPGNHHYTASGTSLAAPIVTGIAAAIRSYRPELKASEIAELLRDTCSKPQAKGDRTVEDSCISGGIVSAENAVSKAMAR